MGNRKPHSGLKHDKTLMTNDPNRKLKLQCAVCGKAIGSADAWFAAETKPPGQGRGLVIEPLRGPLALGQEPLCSEGCVLERVARFISSEAQRGSQRHEVVATHNS